jgi:hypothetical protein
MSGLAMDDLLAGGGGSGGVGGDGTQWPEREVVVRGVKRRLRALTAGESQRLRRIFDRPAPPMVPDFRGNPEKTPLYPDEFDHRYRAAMERWLLCVKALDVAAALGLSGYAECDGDAKKLKAWGDQVVKTLVDAPPPRSFAGPELQHLWEIVQGLGDAFTAPDGKDLVEEAKKALSALPEASRRAVLDSFPPNSPTSTPSADATGS